jgi:hypothetical protein
MHAIALIVMRLCYGRIDRYLVEVRATEA